MYLLGNVVKSNCLDFVGYSAKCNWVSASEVCPHTAIINLQCMSLNTDLWSADEGNYVNSACREKEI